MRPKRVGVYLAALLIAVVGLSQTMANAAANGGASPARMVGWILGVAVLFVVARWIGRRWDPDRAP